MHARVQADKVGHQSGRKRNLSPLHLTAFKPTRKESRIAIAVVLQSLRPSCPFLTSDLQPQERKWPPIQIPKGAKTDQGVYSPSLTPPYWWTLPAPRPECTTFCHVSRAHALSLDPGAGSLTPAPKCLQCLDHFFVYRWTLHPSTQRKTITNSLS